MKREELKESGRNVIYFPSSNVFFIRRRWALYIPNRENDIFFTPHFSMPLAIDDILSIFDDKQKKKTLTLRMYISIITRNNASRYKRYAKKDTFLLRTNEVQKAFSVPGDSLRYSLNTDRI